jgi:hypothetical protein
VQYSLAPKYPASLYARAHAYKQTNNHFPNRYKVIKHCS